MRRSTTSRLSPVTNLRDIKSTNQSAGAELTIASSCSDQFVSEKIAVQRRATHPISGGCLVPPHSKVRPIDQASRTSGCGSPEKQATIRNAVQIATEPESISGIAHRASTPSSSLREGGRQCAGVRSDRAASSENAKSMVTLSNQFCVIVPMHSRRGNTHQPSRQNRRPAAPCPAPSPPLK